MITKIYGASDDLIEIEGAINDEANHYDIPDVGIKLECSDGTKGKLTYDGEWHIKVDVNGSKFRTIINSVGDDAEHTNPDSLGCTSYSDVLILDDGIEWVKIGRKTFKP
jgi:hypothetical protein